MSNPWWYSGATGSQSERRLPTFDFSLITQGAQFVVDLARDTLFSGHETHGQPQDHPDCLLCRAQGVMTDATGPQARGARDRRVVDWLPLDD